jgi:DNA-binding transcriptional LysR family regulator
MVCRGTVELRHLITFVAITEEGTLTAAAQRLYKTQGAVSHDLKTLESQCGLQLIDRSGQRIRLTAAGEALLPYARELVRRVHDLEVVTQRFRRGELADVIRVGTLSSLSAIVLDRAIQFHRANADAAFTFYSEVRGMLVNWLRDGTLDLAVAEPGVESDIEATVVARDDMVVVLPPGDPLDGRAEVTPNDLADRMLVGFTRELGASQLTSRFFMSVGRYPPPVVELNDARLMKQLIRSGVGYALMPSSTMCDGDDLVTVQPTPALPREIAILRPRDRVDSVVVHKFHDHLAETLDLPST